MLGRIPEQLEKKSAYAFAQLLFYMRFQDRVFARQLEFLETPMRAAVMRVICDGELAHDRGTSAASISQSIGVPRETVRRHLSWLQRRGWVMKEGKTYRLGPALLGEPLEQLDAIISDLQRTADQIRDYERNALQARHHGRRKQSA